MAKEYSENKKTYRLIIQPNYYRNLDEIVTHIAFEKNQPLNALKVAEGINATMQKIASNPLMYSPCENLPTQSNIYREARFKSWLIVFKLSRSQITILGVLSGRKKSSAFKKITKG